MSGTTKVIAAATVVSGIVIFINLGVIVGLLVEIGEFQKDVIADMQEFNAVADQTWTTILVSAPAASAREKRRARSNSCGGCSAQPNKCPRGPSGPRGRPGAKGPDGVNGIPGPDAYGVAGLVMMATGKKACIKCAPGPRGFKGHNGLPGRRGADGAPGRPGVVGSNGQDGAPGVRGDAGVAGGDGIDGPRGHPGSNSMRGRGATGAPGRVGERGNEGKQGLKGTMGVPGTPGPMGPPGVAGRDGEKGLDGLTGAVGPVGAAGKNGEYCLCPKKEKPTKTEQVVKNDRGYEQPEDSVIQRLVDSSAIRMEAPEAPPLSSTIGYTDRVVIATTQEPSPPAQVEGKLPAAAPSVEPALPAADYGEPVEIIVAVTQEPTPVPPSSTEDVAPVVSDVAAVAEALTNVGYEEPAVEATSAASERVPSTSTAPPGFSPKSFVAAINSTSSALQGHDAAAASVAAHVGHELPVVKVTPIPHRATGGGRSTTTTAPIPTTTTAAPLAKFVKHAGGWSRRAASHPNLATRSRTHDAELHVQRRAFGGAVAV